MSNAQKISPTISIEHPEASRDFYIKYFNAKVKFDCGWYINVVIGDCDLCFMQPQSSDQPLFNGKGLMYNFEIEELDKEHNRLLSLGLTAVVPLEDHPWGDRGFGVVDPNGIILYFYKVIEPTEEFKKYYK